MTALIARAVLQFWPALYLAMDAIHSEHAERRLLAIFGEDYDVWHAGPNHIVHSDDSAAFK